VIIRTFLMLVLLAVFMPGKAYATGEIYCKAVDGRSGEIFLSVGRLPVLGILSARVSAFGKTWSTEEDAENKIVIGQAYEDKSRMFVDFTNKDVSEILISLQTVKMRSEKEYGEAGVLRIAQAVYPVVCDGG